MAPTSASPAAATPACAVHSAARRPRAASRLSAAVLLVVLGPAVAWQQPQAPRQQHWARRRQGPRLPAAGDAPGASTVTTAVDPALQAWLEPAAGQEALEPGLQRVLASVFTAASETASRVAVACCDSFSCFADYDGEQLAVDQLAEETILSCLAESGAVALASSAELQVAELLGGAGYAVSFDALDGSSIIDTNFAVGSSFGVFAETGKETFKGVTGRDLQAAAVVLYGPRTVLSLAVAGRDDVHSFLLGSDGKTWSKVNTFAGVAATDAQLYAPGNLNAIQDNPGYAQLVTGHWLPNPRMRIRYSGGFLPDVHQIIAKGRGVFAHAASPSCPSKLHLLYQVMPAAFLIEKAGGLTSDGGADSALDLVVRNERDRTQFVCGTAEEVERFQTLVGTPVVAAEVEADAAKIAGQPDAAA